MMSHSNAFLIKRILIHDTIQLQNTVFPGMSFNSKDQCYIKIEESSLVRLCFAKQS